MTLKKLCLGILAFSLLAVPAVAQKSHSNKGGADNRADAVQATNKKDKDKDPLPDNDKKGKHKGETKGKHKAKGHSH